VLDDDGTPLAGAQVRVAPVETMGVDPEPRALAAGGGPEAVVTGEDGEWSFARLAPGAWWISVKAEGFRPAQGWLQVPAEGPGERTVIRLVDLDVVSPRFAEGNPRASVRGWLESGDALLEQGRAAEARAEYRKALETAGVLDAAQRAQVLQTLARTHFLDGDPDSAVRALKAALVLAPESERARRLLTILLEDRGLGEEAGRFLARLESEPDALAEELDDLLGPEEDRAQFELPDRPTLEPEAGRTGRYRVAFTGRSPLSGVGEFVERYGADRAALRSADPSDGAYDLTEETFEVLAPESYRPGEGWGLLVWVSPGSYGGTERPETLRLLEEHRLLWIGANRSGNTRFTWDRIGLALDAAHNMTALYDLSPDRVYVAGYSGGGRITSALAMLYPEVFRGGLSVFGCNFYRQVPIPHRPGTHWPAMFREPPRRTLQAIRTGSRFVLYTGERDFNRAQTRATFEAMREAGFEHVHYLEVPGADHYSGLDPEWIGRALDLLDDHG
jgi:tetratricopeptide (TPR) repeat protein